MTETEEQMLRIIQRKFGYGDNELEIFKNNPRNIDLINRRKELSKTTFVLEVIESKGCNSNHRVGEKFYFDYAGNILTKAMSCQDLRLLTKFCNDDDIHC